MAVQPTIRRRALPFIGPESGQTWFYYKPLSRLYTQKESLADTVDCNGIQVTESSGHPFHNRRSRRSGQDLGGPFFTQSKEVVSGISNTNVSGDTFDSSVYGHCITCVFLPSFAGKLQFPPASPSSQTEIDELGATAIARCKPTNSVASLSTAVGEIMKDGLPSIIGSQTWRNRALTAKSAGSEYLNTAFGWSPLVNDIQKFVGGVTSLESVLRQYERDAGRVVRRSFNFPVSKSEITSPIGSASRQVLIPDEGILNSPDFGSQAYVTRETVKSRWFSGAFTYTLPRGYDSRTTLGKYALIADRLGLELTPTTLWELAPWSWAVDWFSNTGDVISNLQDFVTSGLVMRYGYMMESTIVTDTYTRPGSTGRTGGVRRAEDLVLINHIKIRRQANPFGFGVSWDGLSTFQLSILAALGLSRG